MCYSNLDFSKARNRGDEDGKYRQDSLIRWNSSLDSVYAILCVIYIQFNSVKYCTIDTVRLKSSWNYTVWHVSWHIVYATVFGISFLSMIPFWIHNRKKVRKSTIMRRVKEDMDSGSDAEGKVQCTLKLHPDSFWSTHLFDKFRY